MLALRLDSGRLVRFLRRFVLWWLMPLALLAAWDLTKPRLYWAEEDLPAPVRPNGGVPPWNAGEEGAQHYRGILRRMALASLDQPGSDLCQPKGRRRLLRDLEAYFDLRGRQERDYPARWGTEGRDYITHEWSTADDNRIERLVQELTERGYLGPAQARPKVAARLGEITKDIRVASAPCRE